MDILFDCQQVPEELIDRYKNSIQNGRNKIPHYQTLSEKHILANIAFYSTESLLMYQKITFCIVEAMIKSNYQLFCKHAHLLNSNSKALVRSVGHSGSDNGGCIVITGLELSDSKMVLLVDSQTGKTQHYQAHNPNDVQE